MEKYPPRQDMRSLQLVAFRLKALNVYVAQNCQEVVGERHVQLLLFSPGLKPHLKQGKAHPGVGWLCQWMRLERLTEEGVQSSEKFGHVLLCKVAPSVCSKDSVSISVPRVPPYYIVTRDPSG